MVYRHQISQRGGKLGKFVKANNDADQCHDCFVQMVKNSKYQPKWATLQKDPATGKWITLPDTVAEFLDSPPKQETIAAV